MSLACVQPVACHVLATCVRDEYVAERMSVISWFLTTDGFSDFLRLTQKTFKGKSVTPKMLREADLRVY
jgi:hypothetical protein